MVKEIVLMPSFDETVFCKFIADLIQKARSVMTLQVDTILSSRDELRKQLEGEK
jgi:hypothetical protein